MMFVLSVYIYMYKYSLICNRKEILQNMLKRNIKKQIYKNKLFKNYRQIYQTDLIRVKLINYG